MKICVVKTNRGRLANQLWTYAGVFSYCQEKKYKCYNLPFAKYQAYFGIKTGKWLIDNLFSKLPNMLQDMVIAVYANYVKIRYCDHMVEAYDYDFFLPPTNSSNSKDTEILHRLELGDDSPWFFSGWLFRNPLGEKKYKEEIRSFFTPTEEHRKRIHALLHPFHTDNTLVVGVHIRQGDYKKWNGGAYFFSQEEVRGILDQFLKSYGSKEKIVFVLCSDGAIDDYVFSGLGYVKGLNTEIEDLYTLASCDLIIGSNSTYGSWAAYYGSIPFVQFSKDKIDWSKYEIVRSHDNS